MVRCRGDGATNDPEFHHAGNRLTRARSGEFRQQHSIPSPNRSVS
jgi:hypothetical protein